MKLDIPDEYVPLVVTALEHYHAYTRAIQREDARNRRLPIGSSGGALRRLKSGSLRPSGSGLKTPLPTG